MAERLATKTLLKIGNADGPPETFDTVLDVMDISAPGFSVDTEEITSHSTANFFRKFGPTLIDAGEISFDVLWDPSDTEHQGILTDLQARTKRNFRLEFPGSTTNARWEFAGYFTAFQPEPPIDEHLKASISIKLTDSITISNNV